MGFSTPVAFAIVGRFQRWGAVYSLGTLIVTWLCMETKISVNNRGAANIVIN